MIRTPVPSRGRCAAAQTSKTLVCGVRPCNVLRVAPALGAAPRKPTNEGATYALEVRTTRRGPHRSRLRSRRPRRLRSAGAVGCGWGARDDREWGLLYQHVYDLLAAENQAAGRGLTARFTCDPWTWEPVLRLWGWERTTLTPPQAGTCAGLCSPARTAGTWWPT